MADNRTLTIDVGSGSNPWAAADVLVDLSDEQLERSGALVKDRPFVYADAQALPFRDDSFDYSVCRHVLEHVQHPDLLLQELSRISAGGYIESPNALCEILEGWHFHRWIISVRGEVLEIRENNVPRAVRALLDHLEIPHLPEYAHFRSVNHGRLMTVFRWRGAIRFRKVPPFDWDSVDVRRLCENPPAPKYRASVYSRFRFVLPARFLKPFFMLQTTVNKRIHERRRNRLVLEKILCCPMCLGGLDFEAGSAICRSCDRRFPKSQGHYNFILSDSEISEKTRVKALQSTMAR